MTQLAVSEIFGPTFQGEGKFAGRRTSFLRLSGCNLNCSWCDTPYTWDWTGQNGVQYNAKQQTHMLGVEEVAKAIDLKGCKHIVITGGEPLLQQKNLLTMIRYLRQPHEIEVETNGTIEPSIYFVDYIKHFDVSPKLSNSGIPVEKRYNFAALWALACLGKVSFKFVVTKVEDLDEVDEMVHQIYGAVAPTENIWIMPEGRTALGVVSKARELADEVLARGYNLTLRQQVLLWGTERGR